MSLDVRNPQQIWLLLGVAVPGVAWQAAKSNTILVAAGPPVKSKGGETWQTQKGWPSAARNDIEREPSGTQFQRSSPSTAKPSLPLNWGLFPGQRAGSRSSVRHTSRSITVTKSKAVIGLPELRTRGRQRLGLDGGEWRRYALEQSSFGDYGRTVWEVYTDRRGSELPLASSMEQALMRFWYDQGYPVRVVAMALRLTKGKARSLLYFEGPVDEEYQRWRRALEFGGKKELDSIRRD